MLLAVSEVAPLSEATEFSWNVARLVAAGTALVVSLALGTLMASQRRPVLHRIRMLSWSVAWFFLFGIQVLMMANTNGPIGRWEYVLSTVILGVVYSFNAVSEYIAYWARQTPSLSRPVAACVSCAVPPTISDKVLPTLDAESPPATVRQTAAAG
jgi:hypothetical protein